MPGPFHGWLYALSPDDQDAVELINHARTEAYLRTIGLPDGMLQAIYTDNGGCDSYPYHPPCETGETTNPSYASWPTGATNLNRLTIPDAANISAPSQLDIRFAITGVASGSGQRTILAHYNTTGNQRSYYVRLESSDQLAISTSTDGITGTPALCDVALATNDDLVLGRVTWLTTGGVVQFFRKTDVDPDDIATEMDLDTGWSQIGTNEVASTAALHNSTGVLSIGNLSDPALGQPYVGRIYAVSLATTINAAPVFRLVPSDITGPAASTLLASTGQTVTVVRAGSGPALSLYVDDFEGWDPLSFVSPTVDAAPWYSANFPESADGLGFWIEDWTGLDNSHVVRSTAPKGGAGGGSQLGVISASGRVQSLNVLVFGRSEKATQYLFDWLAGMLTNYCAPCSSNSVLIRRHCGQVPDLWDGVARMNSVGLIGGPQWEVEPTSFGRCYLRRLSFTLEAADPCMYLKGTTVENTPVLDEADVTTCLASLTLAPLRDPCRPSCYEITQGSDCRSSFFYEVPASPYALAPVLTLFNQSTEYSIPLRAIVYYDPLGVEASPGVVDPCGLMILGEVYVRPLRPGATFIWDVAARDVKYHDYESGELVPGWAFTEPNDPPLRRHFTLECGQVILVIEPSTACLDALGGGVYTDGTYVFSAPHFPTPSLEIVPRVSCP